MFAIVTGAASGIGLATAQKLSANGFDVGLVDRDDIGLRAAAGQLAETGASVTTMAWDLERSADTTQVVKALLKGRVGVDALVNNAGIGVAGNILETTQEEWVRTLAVNLSGVFNMTRAVLPYMLEAGQGVIVNVASVAGLVGLRRRAAYCASKAGVIGLTRSVAADFAPLGVRVNAICPGTVDTPWVRRITADSEDPIRERAAMAARQLSGEMGTAEDVAEGIYFLISKGGRFVNGSTMVMDGGMTAV